MAFKLNWKVILVIGIASVFIIPILHQFLSSSGGEIKNIAYITVDFNEPGKSYTGKMNINENSTVLTVVAAYVPTVEFREGRIECMIDYCNSNYSEWKMYKIEQTGIADIEVEIESINECVEPGERLVFRYEQLSS